MERQIFLDGLRRALHGKISEEELTGHIRYYEDYISKETAGGRSEREVLEELGDPRLLARTIAETAKGRRNHEEYTVSEDGQEEGSGVHVRSLDGWKAKLAAAAVILGIVLILMLVFHLVIAILPFLCVLCIIGWLIKKLQR